MLTRHYLANAIRALSMDSVQNANSGHPGAPMGMADIAEVLWNDFLQHDPANPDWLNRDRFVLSNGHASVLLYSLLHLSGYALTIKDLHQFRQLDSLTPGHPEYGHTPGIDTTTGPLGQGLANAVGMAIAERTLATQFNRPGYPVIDHYTYVFMGDGCLMEGISHEACSLAGTLQLGKLIAFYDDNGISIDGKVQGWFTDDTAKRFESYGWHVQDNIDGHDPEALINAIHSARESGQPSLICCKTIIGKGSPNKQGSAGCHGSPLGDEEISQTRASIDWPHPPFSIPEEVYSAWDAKEEGNQRFMSWSRLMAGYTHEYPELSYELQRRSQGKLPEHFSQSIRGYIDQLQQQGADIASRKASLDTLEAMAPMLPELLGGSADLAASNLTCWSDAHAITRENPGGNYLNYGVREFAMSAIMNGISLHGGYIPYGGTFLVFMDYARNAVRLTALMEQRVIFVYTHDSIGLGEDGPTHQPVEQLTTLRATPNLDTWRPCDAVETAVSWKTSIERHDGPSALVLSRQTLPLQQRSLAMLPNIERGGYVLSDCDGEAELILIATGSEVALAMQAKSMMPDRKVRVVSMPCTSAFDRQEKQYRHYVLPPETAKTAIEALHPDFWHKYVGTDGCIIGVNRFGKSAPGGALMKHFGFTPEGVVERICQHFGW